METKMNQHPVYDQIIALLPDRLRANMTYVDVKEGAPFNGPLPKIQTDEDASEMMHALIRVADYYGAKTVFPTAWDGFRANLVKACLLLLGLWFPTSDCTLFGLLTVLDLGNSNADVKPLDLLFRQIETGMKYVRTDKGTWGEAHEDRESTWEWKPSKLVRNTDGRKPGDVVDGYRGMAPDEDVALHAYHVFLNECPPYLRRQVAGLTIDSFSTIWQEFLGLPDQANDKDADLRLVVKDKNGEIDYVATATALIDAGCFDGFDQLYAASIQRFLATPNLDEAAAEKFRYLLEERVQRALQNQSRLPMKGEVHE